MARETRVEMLEQKSRFIAVGVPTTSVAAFKEALEKLQQEFPDANHIAYAYRIKEDGDLKIRFHDADEPAGTAGRPILAHLEGTDVMNCTIFVIRYFGGIKLGTGGLVRAYGQAARLCLLSAPLAEDIAEVLLELSFEFKDQRQVEYLLARYNAKPLAREFGDHVLYRVAVQEPFLEKLQDDFSELRIPVKRLNLAGKS
jgi:uncharacterized YigZ family protein